MTHPAHFQRIFSAEALAMSIKDLASRIAEQIIIGPAVFSSSTTPSPIDLTGFQSAAMALQVGTGGITFTTTNYINFVMTHSDDNVTWTNVPLTSMARTRLRPSPMALSWRSPQRIRARLHQRSAISAASDIWRSRRYSAARIRQARRSLRCSSRAIRLRSRPTKLRAWQPPPFRGRLFP